MSFVMKMIGYHGTNAENETSIIQNNFFVSSQNDDWLGTGAYFFIDGLLDPAKCAESWAKVSSYDKIKRKNVYERYAVMSATLDLEEPFDLDEKENLEAYHIYREAFFENLKKNKVKAKGALHNDCQICNLILNDDELEIDAIIRREYIKLESEYRIKKYDSRIPNCRIVSIKNPKKSVCNIKTDKVGGI